MDTVLVFGCTDGARPQHLLIGVVSALTDQESVKKMCGNTVIGGSWIEILGSVMDRQNFDRFCTVLFYSV